MKRPEQKPRLNSKNDPKPRIYLYTSVISYYTSRLHSVPLIRSRQMLTKRWWEKFQARAEFYISTYVLEEIAKGDASAARIRVSFVKECAESVSNFQSELFGEVLFRELAIPVRSKVDAWHLAIAALSRQDYIVSWNFKHMANIEIQKVYGKACEREGLPIPQILTPEQMLDLEAI